jgi:hypothetical protein
VAPPVIATEPTPLVSKLERYNLVGVVALSTAIPINVVLLPEELLEELPQPVTRAKAITTQNDFKQRNFMRAGRWSAADESIKKPRHLTMSGV